MRYTVPSGTTSPPPHPPTAGVASQWPGCLQEELRCPDAEGLSCRPLCMRYLPVLLVPWSCRARVDALALWPGNCPLDERIRLQKALGSYDLDAPAEAAGNCASSNDELCLQLLCSPAACMCLHAASLVLQQVQSLARVRQEVQAPA